MQYIKGLKDYHDDSQTAVTLGKFDGVHRGHEKLVEKVIEYADTAGVKSVVCAFDMLAFSKKHVDERCILMTKEEREDRLHDRVDYLVDCPFTREFSQVLKILSGMCWWRHSMHLMWWLERILRLAIRNAAIFTC